VTKPMCSIIIPSYNCREYLPAALNSIRVQNAGLLEILILDDGSTDGSWDYLQCAKAEFPELVTVRGEQLGPSEARNLLISMAKSDLVAFLDADDYWWPDKLRRQIAFHQENPEVLFSFSDYLHVDMKGITHGTAFEFWKSNSLLAISARYRLVDRPVELLLGCNLVGTSTVMARTDALQNAKGFAKEMPSAEDWDLWLRLAERGKVAYSSSVTMSYLQRKGSLTSNRHARLEAMKQIIGRYEAKATPTMRLALHQAWSRYYEAEAEHYRADLDFVRAAKSHFTALTAHPKPRLAKAFAADLLSFLVGQRRVLVAE
jgi:glycosyltransferase involved in cell wall biosynthesis